MYHFNHWLHCNKYLILSYLKSLPANFSSFYYVIHLHSLLCSYHLSAKFYFLFYYQIVHMVHYQSLGLMRETLNHFIQKSTRAQLWLWLQRKDLIYKKNSCEQDCGMID